MDVEKTGNLIAQARKQRGWTQKELAQKLSVTDKAVSKWERGLSFPDVSLLSPISEILDIPIECLITGEQNVNTSKESVMLDTIKVSNNQIERKSKKNKKIFAALISLSLVLCIFLGVCFGIAFTPADSFTSMKISEMTVSTITGSADYTLHVKGRMSGFPPETVRYAKSVKGAPIDVLDSVKNEIAVQGNKYEIIPTPANNIILIERDNQNGTKDFFCFSTHQSSTMSGYKLTSLAPILYSYDEGKQYEHTISFPICYMLDQDLLLDGEVLHETVEYRLIESDSFSVIDKIKYFYEAGGYYDVGFDDYSITVHPRYETTSLYPNQKTISFKIEFSQKSDSGFVVFTISVID